MNSIGLDGNSCAASVLDAVCCRPTVRITASAARRARTLISVSPVVTRFRRVEPAIHYHIPLGGCPARIYVQTRELFGSARQVAAERSLPRGWRRRRTDA